MSKATTTAESDVSPLDTDDERFNATAQALPWGRNLRGTDRQFVRQFIEVFNNSLIDSYDPIVLKRAYRNDRGTELRVHLENTSTTVGYNRVQRAVAATDYVVSDMRVLSGRTVSLAFTHINE